MVLSFEILEIALHQLITRDGLNRRKNEPVSQVYTISEQNAK
jgi:hypothetical protein